MITVPVPWEKDKNNAIDKALLHWSNVCNDANMTQEKWLLEQYNIKVAHWGDCDYISGNENDVVMFLLRWS